MFKLRFAAVTDDTTVTPILLSYHLTGILYPPQRQIIACTVRCANEIQTKLSGAAGIERGNYTLIKNCLERARQATYPISIRDIDGTTKTVKFLPLPSDIPQWTLIRDEKDRVQERHYNVLMQCVDIS